MSLTIRPIEQRDIEAVVALWETCGLVVPWNDPHDDIALCRRSPNAEIMVGVVEDGDIVAGALVGHDGHRGWLYYVAVHPDRQGHGDGRRIIGAAERWVLGHGVPKMQLMIRPTNTAVRDFYAKLGYLEEERLVMSRRFEPRPPVGDTPIDTTVTYLEMRHRPTRATVPTPAGRRLSLIRMDRPSVPFYRFLYDAVGGPWHWIERRLLSDDELACAITGDNVEIYVLNDAGAPAGFCEMTRDPGGKIGEVEITYFGLLPDSIGKGLGWYFLNAVIDIAWNSEPGRVTLNTCDLDHPRALPNYQRAGFEVCDRAVRHLPDPRRAGLPLPPPMAERHARPA